MKNYLIFFMIMVWWWGCQSHSQDTNEQPDLDHTNFVILFADDLGYGDLSCYGHPTITTPNLDQMAEEGIRFTSFYAGAPVCTPSRAALLTGRYSARVGLPHVLGPDSQNGIDPSEILISEALKSLDYNTKIVGKWHLGSTKPEHYPTANGFDSYYGILYSNDMMPPWVKTERPLTLTRDTAATEEYPVDQRSLTVRYTREAVEFIEASKDEPFFLYFPYSMPHLPINAVDSLQGRSKAGLYGDVIETIDWSVGAVLQTLKAHGLDQNTMVVFTSDNGPWQNLPVRMLQEGIRPWHVGSAGHLRGHKATTWEGGVRVPAVMRWPGVIPEKQVTAEVASVLDLFPTIVKAAGGEVPQDRVYDGQDIMPLLTGQTNQLGERTFLYLSGSNVQAIRKGPWKFRQPNPEEPGELYQLNIDPSEMYNRADEFPEMVQQLKAEIQQMQEELDNSQNSM